MRALICSVLAVWSFGVSAAPYVGEGKVVDLLLRTSHEHYAILYVSGFSEAGECVRFRDHVAIAIPDDGKGHARYSMLLGSYMADKTVHVTLDDAKQSADGLCIVQDLRLSKSF